MNATGPAAALDGDALLAYAGIAEQAAREAAAIVAEGQSAVVAEMPRDVKVAADYRSHAVLSERLSASFPVVSEEGTADGLRTAADGLHWIIDPLDGSVNFSRGIPFSCISIGLWDADRPLIGVVLDFTRDEMFTGIVGVGARLNGQGISVSRVTRSDHAILCSGLPVGGDWSDEGLRRFAVRARAFKKIRYLGSAGLSLAYVAAGRADAYQEEGIAIWDIAGGAALVVAAGGFVQVLPGLTVMTRHVAAANGALLACDALTPSP